jgi:hypothetical protein
LIGTGSKPDPFPVTEYPPQGAPNGVGYQLSAGRTLLSSIIATPATTKTILIGGQSNMASGGTVAYTTVSANAQNLNIYDGGIYAGAEPVLGCSYAPNAGPSSLCMRLMDRIISQGKATRAIGVPFAMGGTIYSEWVPGASANLFSRISTAILRCRARGLQPDKIIWGEGETDAGAGTSAASITASINAIVDGIRAMGCVAPFYIGYYTYAGGATNATVRSGITNSVDVTGRKIMLGFDCDTLTSAGGYRIADNVHLSNTGLDASAIGWQGIIFP